MPAPGSSQHPEMPVLLGIWRRPGTLDEVCSRLSDIGPRTLYVAADGPADESQREKIEEARGVVEGYDWDCPVYTEYSEQHLGLIERWESALDWFFSNVESGIVLQDDVIPHPDLFRFCKVMLDRYEDHDKVMSVCGTNMLGTWRDGRQDYHFSNMGGFWGWATWSDAWDAYDTSLPGIEKPSTREKVRHRLGDRLIAKDWLSRFMMSRDQPDIEDDTYPWHYAHLTNGACSVVPSRNLVKNIGFGPEATNTKMPDHPFNSLPTYSIDRPIRHPGTVEPDTLYDQLFYDLLVYGGPLWARKAVRHVSRGLQVPELAHPVNRSVNRFASTLRGTA